MLDIGSWDWGSEEKMLAEPAKWKDQFEDVWEPYVSPDGEKIASIVKIGEGEFNMCVNGSTWEEPFEKMWYSRFSPDGRLTVLISKDMEVLIQTILLILKVPMVLIPRLKGRILS